MTMRMMPTSRDDPHDHEEDVHVIEQRSMQKDVDDVAHGEAQGDDATRGTYGNGLFHRTLSL